jgi:hypothetical protein
MINLQWGNYTNGRIPTSVLAPIDSGHLLRPDAAAQWQLLVAACKAATGQTLSAAPGADSGYRTFAQQQQDWNIYHGKEAVAVPGTSNHGWGRAIDITGYETGSDRWVNDGLYYNPGPVWAWLQANAPKYGFTWSTGFASLEAWHWEYTQTPTITAGPTVTISQEDDMKLIQDAETQTVAVVGANRYWPIGKSTGASNGTLGAIEKVWGQPIMALTHDEFLENMAAAIGRGHTDISKPYPA